jgi:hypothetical protein
MSRCYTPPSYVRYGSLDRITLGSATPLPDIDQFGNTVGSGCVTSTFVQGGSTVTRTSCQVSTIVPSSPAV